MAATTSTPVAIRAGRERRSALDAPVPPQEPTVDDFTAVVSAASAMFGDPTRRRIYLLARSNPAGITAATAASECELHPNVARHHLDKLVAGGYLDVTLESQEGRSGRPSKRYRTTGKPVDLAFGARRHDLVTTLLGRALDLLPADVASRMAEEVGEHYGRELAEQMNPTDQQRSKRAALHAVADALTAHGFAAHAEAHADTMSLVRDHCPFGELSATHPVICAVDRGLVRGMLRQLYGDADPALTSSRPMGDDVCVSTV